ncbi:MAG: hypothetical protein L0Y56_15170, partial [Nitrospira sp.]|nr:hypothetical protein [Nitrospira sp.]
MDGTQFPGRESRDMCLSFKNASTEPPVVIVTIQKQPEVVERVCRTNAKWLRSRMTVTCHVRFCSRVGVATLQLRQRLQLLQNEVRELRGLRGMSDTIKTQRSLARKAMHEPKHQFDDL